MCCVDLRCMSDDFNAKVCCGSRFGQCNAYLNRRGSINVFPPWVIKIPLCSMQLNEAGCFMRPVATHSLAAYNRLHVLILSTGKDIAKIGVARPNLL